jgi:hypothetical protein
MSQVLRRSLVALLTVLTFSSLLASPASAAKKPPPPPPPATVGDPAGRFSCRAALARVEGAGLLSGVNAELFTANPQGDPCQTDFSGILASLNTSATLYNKHLLTTALLSADLKVLYGGTQLLKDAGYSLPRQGVAEAGVALLKISVLGIGIEVAVLTSNAKAACSSNLPTLNGRSTVVGLKINGRLIDDAVGVKISLGEHVDIKLAASLLASLEVKTLFASLFTLTQLDLLLQAGLTLHLNHQDKVVGPGFGKVTQRAVWLESNILGNVILSESIADYHGNPCTTTTGPPPPPPPPVASKGWMTGGGRINTAAGKMTHGSRLECTATAGPNTLQVNWSGSSFHLKDVLTARCDNGADGKNLSGNPTAGFDTLTGSGTGLCNGNPVAAQYVLTDNGEPGTADTFAFTITSGSCAVQAAGALERGNHQAHGRP